MKDWVNNEKNQSMQPTGTCSSGDSPAAAAQLKVPKIHNRVITPLVCSSDVLLNTAHISLIMLFNGQNVLLACVGNFFHQFSKWQMVKTARLRSINVSRFREYIISMLATSAEAPQREQKNNQVFLP